MTQPTSKRQDLQGIRGLAILSVLGFHFYSFYFPNGYLGVDQFFVLSGFLMCMLLTKTESMPILSGIIHFYTRRFKRILPLYLLFILLTVVALYTVFSDTALLQNQSSATKALLFVSNRPHTGEEDYFEKLLIAIDLFTHTWSLSVEIQFYFIVPLIFLIGNAFTGYFKYGYYTILGLISFVFYSILPPEVAFNSLFARIWQFIIGMMIFLNSLPQDTSTNTSISYKLLSSAESGETENVPLVDDLSEEDEDMEVVSSNSPSPKTYIGPFSKYFFLIPMGFVVTYPIAMFPFLVRPLFTCFTGFLMLVSIDDEFLSNRILTYIGDISYSLYLIHWPIYAYSKITFENNPYALAVGLLASVTLAIIVYETYEKWYLKLSNTSCALLIILLFIVNVVLINKDAIQDMIFMEQIESMNGSSGFERLDGVNENMTFDDATRLNQYWNKYDLEMMIEPGCVKRTPKHSRWCDYELNGDEFKIAAFGNSYTKNHHKMFVQECKNRAYNITFDSERGCEPLAATPSDHGCVKKLAEFVEFIESAKPDYAFIFTRFFAVADPFKENNNTNLVTDRTYQEMKSQLNKFLPNIKKKLFILDSFPRANAGYISKIAGDLKKGKKIEEVSKAMLRPDGYERGRFRHAHLVKECGTKCELIDYLPLFWNNATNMYQYFDDRGFSYFTSPNHLSARGMELVRPIYTKLCANLNK